MDFKDQIKQIGERVIKLKEQIQTEIDENHQPENISVFPNPAKNYIDLKTDVHQTGSLYIIHDLMGRTLARGKILNEKTPIDLTNFPAGIYTLTTDNNLSTLRVVKE